MKVRSLDASLRPAYVDFIQRCDDATFFHDLRWLDLVEKVAGFESKTLVVENDGALSGAFPLSATRSPLSGAGLVSTPHAVYGGPLSDDAQALDALLGGVREMIDGGRYEFAEVRGRDHRLDGLFDKDLYVTFIKDLPENPADCLTMIPRKSRASARQARDKHHMSFIAGWHLLDPFYDLFVLNKRALGSPVFSRSFFQSFFDYFPDEVVLHGVKYDGEIVATVMSFIWRDTLMAYYSGSIKEAERLGTMNFMYWKLMEWAAERGLKKFDFGRSRKETGAFKFKKNMGFEATPLPYQFMLKQGTKMPDVNPGNPRFSFVRKAWSHLPVPVVRFLGPKLMRYLP